MNRRIQRIKEQLMWNLYYGYKSLLDSDVEGGYSLSQKILMFLHLTYVHCCGDFWGINKQSNNIEYNTDTISDIIYNTLNNNNPCMIARFGSIEQTVVANYISINSKEHNITKLITGEQPYWWWDKKIRKELKSNAGFFPNESKYIEKYCRRMIEDASIVDILSTWYGKEKIILNGNTQTKLIGLQEAEPWWQSNPWTRYLQNKKVLVIHPFAELIETQYLKHVKLFRDERILPNFELKTIKAVQSINGDCDDFDNWFDALKWMEDKMDKIEYDIALIGCGAYGFCLAAHAKRSGKKAIHMGGVLQLLFGIKGKRWEQESYHPLFNYTTLFNNYWVKPDDSLKPKNFDIIEGGCYW